MPTATGTGNLRPFTKGDPRAVAAGRKSVEARRARQALEAGGRQELARALESCVLTFQRGELGTAAAAVAGELLARIAAGRIVVKGPDVAALLRVLVDIARLEAGEPTSASVVAHISTRDALERVAMLRTQAREALGSVVASGTIDVESSLSAAATAAADGTGDGAISADVIEGEG